jgi:hypothetical protein
MNCFYHHDRTSIGACKSCGKGLCPECSVDLGKGLACRGHCEEDVRALITLIDRNIKLSPQSTQLVQSGYRNRFATAFFLSAMGIIFLIWGLKDWDRFSLIAILGICFMAYGLYTLVQTLRVAQKTRVTPPQLPNNR